MAYYIKKQGLSGKVVYWTGGNVWSDDISKKKIGFDSDYNEVTIYYKDKKYKKEKLSFKKKSKISEEIVDRIVARIN